MQRTPMVIFKAAILNRAERTACNVAIFIRSAATSTACHRSKVDGPYAKIRHYRLSFEYSALQRQSGNPKDKGLLQNIHFATVP